MHEYQSKQYVTVVDLDKQSVSHNLQLHFNPEGLFWASNNLLSVNKDLQFVEVIKSEELFETKAEKLNKQIE